MSGWEGMTWTEVLLINAALASILALLVAGIERWRPKALWLHGLWLLVILRFVAPPVVPLEILPAGWLDGDAPSQTQSVSSSEAGPAALRPMPSMPALGKDAPIPSAASMPPVSMSSKFFWGELTKQLSSALGVVWGFVALLMLALTGRQVLRLHTLAKNGTPPSAELHQLALDLASSVGLRRMPRMRVVDDPDLPSPLVLSTLAGPQLLLPKALLDILNDAELSTVLVHEWAHVRRRDHWARWPEWLALVTFWWNPMVWWARRALRRAEERCVDAWVLRLLPERRADYAKALVEAATLGAGSPRDVPVLSSGIETMHSMEERLAMILQGTSRRLNTKLPSWWRWVTWPAVVLSLALLPILGTPFSAGTPDDKETAEWSQLLEGHDPMEMHRLRVRIELAQQHGDHEQAESLQQELQEKQAAQSRDLQASLREHYEAEERRLEGEQQQLEEVLEGLRGVRASRTMKEDVEGPLERQIHRLQLERERKAQELALWQERDNVMASQEARERFLQEAQRDMRQRFEALEGQEGSTARAALEAEERALEARAYELETQREQADASLRAKAAQLGLPLDILELRWALEELEGASVSEDVRAELERFQRELGEILDGD